jgi:hypothetical protein
MLRIRGPVRVRHTHWRAESEQASEEKKMKYPAIRYERTDADRLLNLHSFDGTYREVSFRSDGAAADAMKVGRAEADCLATEWGLLPRGATHVSRARPADSQKVLAASRAGTPNEVPPLAKVRLEFSQRLLSRRSDFIDEARNARARERHPDEARRYEMLLAAISPPVGKQSPE